jgi:ribosomal protein S18 acetylase RimI-like enzyme
LDYDRIEIVEVARNKSALCREILTALPLRFGIPEALETYAAEVAALPMLGATAGGSVIGFLALKDQTPFAAEAYVLGVRPEWHRQGVGRKLFEAAETALRQRGIRFFTVKTVAAADDDPVYGGTRPLL